MEDELSIDGVPLDQLLPPPPKKAKRKEPEPVVGAETRLKEGLAAAIGPENKGYQMMLKLGYLPAENTIEPLKIEIRKGKGGLGLFEELQAKAEEEDHLKLESDAKRRKEYEDNMKRLTQLRDLQQAKKRLVSQLLSIIKVARNIREDFINGKHSLELHTYPDTDDPPPILQHELVSASQSDPTAISGIRDLLANLSLDSIDRHLQQLTRYLRDDFNYCYWCGEAFESQEAMNSICPGPPESLHLSQVSKTE